MPSCHDNYPVPQPGHIHNGGHTVAALTKVTVRSQAEDLRLRLSRYADLAKNARLNLVYQEDEPIPPVTPQSDKDPLVRILEDCHRYATQIEINIERTLDEIS